MQSRSQSKRLVAQGASDPERRRGDGQRAEDTTTGLPRYTLGELLTLGYNNDLSLVRYEDAARLVHPNTYQACAQSLADTIDRAESAERERDTLKAAIGEWVEARDAAILAEAKFAKVGFGKDDEYAKASDVYHASAARLRAAAAGTQEP